MIQYLADELKEVIPRSKAAYIAVALLKQYGLNLFENLPETCTRQFLIGIDLPTPPSILSQLLAKQVVSQNLTTVKIHKSQITYHPKVYLFEIENGEYVAFIGSANATKGGLTSNVELSIAIRDQQSCKKIKDWFDTHCLAADELTSVFIERYKQAYKRNRNLSSTQASNIKSLLQSQESGYVYPRIKPGQFFRQSDFDALAPEFHYMKSDLVKERRKLVRKHFVELHNRIYDRFAEFGLYVIAKHQNSANTASVANHNGRTVSAPKDAIWLHYGKTTEELAFYPEDQRTVSYHVRMQVIIKHSTEKALIGIWLYLGKSHSSLEDRKWLIDQFQNDHFEDLLLDSLIALGGIYWIWFADNNVDDRLYVSEIKNATDLRRFLLKDRDLYSYSTELIIGRDYDPNDSLFSDDEIDETVLVEFSKLYKVYNLIKHNS